MRHPDARRGRRGRISSTIGGWDVSQVTDMSFLFMGAAAFNADIGAWDVSQVTTMEEMFFENTVFNQNISGWNVSSVTENDEFKAAAEAFDDDNAPHFP